MIEDNFNSYNVIPEYSSGMITFEEYLERKGESIEESIPSFEFKEERIEIIDEPIEEIIDESIPENLVSSGMITFEEYLERKENYTQIEEVKLSFSDLISVEEDSVPESLEMMTFIKYLESRDLLVKEEDIEIVEEVLPKSNSSDISYTKKSLWDGYVQHVKFHAKKSPVIDIQDPTYLDESRAKYAEFLIEEQQKYWDKIYFFTPGGRPIEEEPEDECAVIGKAVIGKNKIC